MNHIFITGEKGVGKSTLVRNVLNQLAVKSKGFMTVKSKDNYGVYMYEVQNPKPTFDATNCIGMRNDQGGFEAFPAVFDTLGVALLEKVYPCDLIVMDELGIMENRANLFQEKVLKLLNEETPILGVLRLADAPFLNAIKDHPNTTVFILTEGNRQDIFEKVLRCMI